MEKNSIKQLDKDWLYYFLSQMAHFLTKSHLWSVLDVHWEQFVICSLAVVSNDELSQIEKWREVLHDCGNIIMP